jgi:hypothetical protein
MIVLMCILVAYLLFQILITLLNGISFASHPADKAVHHPGSRVSRLKLLQQTSPYWDFTKQMNQAKEKYSHQPAVVDGLNDILLPYVAQSYGNSAMDVAADATQQNIITGALPSFVDLLNVLLPLLIIYIFLLLGIYGVYIIFEMHNTTQKVKLMPCSRTESFKIGQCQQYDVAMWAAHVNLARKCLALACSHVPQLSRHFQEVEKRHGCILRLLFQFVFHYPRRVPPVSTPSHHLLYASSCAVGRYSTPCVLSPYLPTETAILVCSVIFLSFYFTYFIKMHDHLAEFMILLECALLIICHVSSVHKPSRRHMIVSDLSRWCDASIYHELIYDFAALPQAGGGYFVHNLLC